jgi:hypothetical protein
MILFKMIMVWKLIYQNCESDADADYGRVMVKTNEVTYGTAEASEIIFVNFGRYWATVVQTVDENTVGGAWSNAR